MPKNKEHLLLWVIAGIIGVIIRDIYSFLAKQVGFATFYIWLVGADIFLDGPEIHTFFGNILGFLNDLVIGAILGVMIGLIFEWRGSKYYYLKGIGIGLMAWIFFFGILLHSLPHIETEPKNALSGISAFIGHAIFGVITAWIIKKYSVQEATEEVKSENTTENTPFKFRLAPNPAKKPPQQSHHSKFKKPTKLIRIKRN